jgi:hypothetical protein
MNKLNNLLNEIEITITHQELLTESVSAASAGWHIEHSLLTINAIADQLKKSNPGNYRWKFNFTRILVFTLNKIPRGRAKAPGVVVPKNNFNQETLQLHLARTKQNIASLKQLQPNNYFDHPYFGKLNLKPAISFLSLHTKHHLGIVKDIIKNNK